VWTF